MPIVLTGFDELLGTLGEIESKVTKQRILAAAMRKALVPLFDAFDEFAPDDPETPRNRIRDWERKAVNEQSATSVLGRVGDTPKGFVGYFKQWGTEHEPADNFAGRAWDDSQAEVLSILSDELWIGIIDIWNAAEEPLDA